MPTVPDRVDPPVEDSRQRRRSGRRQAVEVRRDQELVVRVWAATAACTALPLALVRGDSTPFTPALMWGFGLGILALVSGFAALSTGQNAHALEEAKAARGEQGVDPTVNPWRGASVGTLRNASWLFRAMTAAYGAAACVVLARASGTDLSSWVLVALAVPWFVALALGLGTPATSSAASPTLERHTNSALSLRASFADADNPFEPEPITQTRSPASPTVAAMPKEPQRRSTTNPAPSHGRSARPSLQFEQTFESTVPAPALNSGTGARRPSSLREALGSVFPEGVALRPDLVSAVPEVARHKPAAERHDSGVQELRKQSLTEPKRRRSTLQEEQARLSQIATEPPPSTVVIDSSERDTERPPSRRTDRADIPIFQESDIPTTPAPASVREATPPDGPASGMLAFELKIPKSPKAPTFGRSDRAMGGPDPEQSFRPTRRAGPFVERGPSDALADALSRPTRPADAEGDLEARLARVTARPHVSESGEHTRHSVDETPKPVSVTRETATQLRPVPSQFEIAYNGRGGPGYIEPSEAESDDRVRDAAPKRSSSSRTPEPSHDGSRRGSPLESEIRWVESAPSTVPGLVSFEAGLLETLQSAVPRADGYRRPKRRTALH
jgi:hypothetical protein